MEMWVLGAGAILLVGIALWLIVQRPEVATEQAGPADSGASHRDRSDEASWSGEVAAAGAGEGATPDRGGVPVQPAADLGISSDAFEDRFTSATGDLSPGAVAQAVEEMREEQEDANMATSPAGSNGGFGEMSHSPSAATWTPTEEPPETRRENDVTRVPRVDARAAAALVLGVVLGAGWLLWRWQRERNRPINRLRRRLRGLTQELGSRLPDTEVVRERLSDADVARPAGGAGAGLLLATLLALRLLRGRRGDTPPMQAAEPATAPAAADGRVDGRSAIEEVRTRWGRIRFPAELRPPAVAEAGMRVAASARTGGETLRTRPRTTTGAAGLLVAGTVGYLLWRALRGGGSPPDPWSRPTDSDSPPTL